MHKNNKKTKGFTLVEMIVSITIFVIAVSVAGGAFVRGLRSQKSIVTLMAINDNASQTLEQMTRELRVGLDYVTPFEDEIHFTTPQGNRVIYRLNELDGTIERSVNGGNYQAITGRQVFVRRLTFILGGTDAARRITIVVGVGSNERELREITTDVQTTVSARNI